MSLNIGIDLSDDYVSAYIYEDKLLLNVPAVVCREKKEDRWHIGEEAFRLTLDGTGVLTDKLLSLLRKNGTSTVSRRAYTAEQLLSKLFASLLSELLGSRTFDEIDRLVVSLRRADKAEMDSIVNAAVLTGLDREKIYCISRSDAFVYYTLSQNKEFYANMAALFDLSDGMLSFYKMKVIRGMSRSSCIVESEDLEENFRIDILKKDTGSELGDRIVTDAAKRCLGNDIYSSVILTGKGFERTDWARGFVEFVCRKRRVVYENSLFAIGASIYAARQQEGAGLPYIVFSDTSIAAEVSIQVNIGERSSKLILIPAGQPWYGSAAYAEVVPHDQDYIDIDIAPVDKFMSRKSVRIELKDFPRRPDRCTKVSLGLNFEDREHMNVTVRDLGFGEIFPSEGTELHECVNLYSEG